MDGAAVGGGGLVSLSLAPGTYLMDTVHSQLSFGVVHLGITTVRGMFDRYSGSLGVGTTLEETLVIIEAEVASLNSGSSLRDEHMRGPDFLDAESHPTVRFRSTDVTATDGGYALVGELTLKGKTLPTTLQATYNGSATFPLDGSVHHGFTATGLINRSEFGLSQFVPLVSDEVTLHFEVQLVAPAET